MSSIAAYRDWVIVPRIAVELPVALAVPDGFEPTDLSTWPEVEGRLEYVGGRLVYMPPCGGDQQRTAAAVAGDVASWCDAHPEFVPGGNEAGMMLGGDVRAADFAVWRRDAVGPPGPGLPRVAPVLAVEIAGKDEPVESLSAKSAWYLDRGVTVVWILVPSTQTVMVRTTDQTTRVLAGERLPPHPALPGLTPKVEDLLRFVRR